MTDSHYIVSSHPRVGLWICVEVFFFNENVQRAVMMYGAETRSILKKGLTVCTARRSWRITRRNRGHNEIKWGING